MSSYLLWLSLSIMLISCAPARQERETNGRPEHHTAKGFRNIHIEDPQKSIFNYLYTKYFGDTVWADHASRAGEVPVRMLGPESLKTATDGLRVSWLGHSTFLLQYRGINILTDPLFADRASPLSGAGPKRYVPHVIDYAELPRVDYVIISHNHYDHLDRTAILELGNEPRYFVPLGLKDWFMENGITAERIHEMDWGDVQDYTGIRLQAMPSQHWSARGLFDRMQTLWASWWISMDDMDIWFAGDTGYNPVQFREIGEKSGGFDLALIPIGGYEPRSFMGPYHVNPEEAIRIHQDIDARQSIGMHWGTFPLTAEGPIDPVREMERQKVIYRLTPAEFISMDVGESLELRLAR